MGSRPFLVKSLIVLTTLGTATAPASAQTNSPAQTLGQPQRTLQVDDLSVGGERPELTPDFSIQPAEAYWTGWVYSESSPLSHTAAGVSGPFQPGNHCQAPRRVNLVCGDLGNLEFNQFQ
ncbi:MAG: hypothetical protein AAFR42_07410 [Cyanobacteria bacterium J06628_6]